MGTTMKTTWELPPMESGLLDWGFVSAWFGIQGCSRILKYGKTLIWFFQGEILHPGKGYNKDEGGISFEGPGLLVFCPRMPASNIRDLS